MSRIPRHFYEFGEFRFDREKRVLWRAEAPVALPPKASEVLLLLLKDHGNLVEREEFLKNVWQDTFVEEGNLNQAVSALRKTLGSEGIIQTVPRRGYRFTAQVKEVEAGIDSELIIQKHTVSDTLIEEREEFGESPETSAAISLVTAPSGARRTLMAATAAFFLIASIASAWFITSRRAHSQPSSSRISTLAVLPMKSFTQSAADEELRLRLTDALITRIGRFDSVVVRSTNSILRFSGEDRDAVEAGKELAVDAVLDGRVQTENGRLRVTLQLISVKSGVQLWSGQFDGRQNELLVLQDAISDRMAKELPFAGNQQIKNHTTENNESYEAYLKGRFLWNKRTRDSYWKALDYFNESVELDPGFALGYTGIADCYHLLQQRNVLSTEEAFSKAEPAARKALELDPTLPEAYISMGSVSYIRYARWTEAESYYRKAIELNPNSAEGHARLGMLLNSWGRFEEAHTELKKAEQLDPTSLNNAIYLGANYYYSKQYDRATAQFKRILEFAPGTERAHFFLSRIYELTGRYDEAVESALNERAISHPDTVAPLRTAYQTSGIRGFWNKQIELLKEESKDARGLENHIASRYVLLGDFEHANEYIEKNLKNLGTMWNLGRVDPIFDGLRSNPRFIELMTKAAATI